MLKSLKVLKANTKQAERWFSELESRRTASLDEAKEVASDVIRQVRRSGDRAVSGYLKKFDRVSIAADEIHSKPPGADAPRDLKAAIDLAIERVGRFHEQQRSESYWLNEKGMDALHRISPLRRVGVYVPGGRAVYLSTLIMCVVPARLAGVKEIVVATTPSAAARPELQYLCAKLGISEIYRCGGAAGVAAMAIGTATLRRVDKIVGPGNRFVTAAKQLLSGEVGIDMTAGPTEVVVVADISSNPVFVAADLLAQAEHGEDSSVVCITRDSEFAHALQREVSVQLAEASEDSAARVSIVTNGAILMTDSDTETIELVNRLAPEHVEIQCEDPVPFVQGIENCGAIFVGRNTPVAAGDYIAGPNHVLPTAGTARFFSPLGVYDFYKRSNVVSLSGDALGALSRSAQLLARFEGLPLHAESIAVRTDGIAGMEVKEGSRDATFDKAAFVRT